MLLSKKQQTIRQQLFAFGVPKTPDINLLKKFFGENDNALSLVW